VRLDGRVSSTTFGYVGRLLLAMARVVLLGFFEPNINMYIQYVLYINNLFA